MDEDQDFFNSMNPKLSGFYSLNKVENEESQKDLFPIQEELKALSEKFQGQKKVGSGAMKEIFEVKDLPSGRQVAKARLRDSSNPKDIESFLREARLTASLQHPNIIRVYDIGYDEYPWFSMELIEGQSLEEKIQHHRSTQEEWPLFQKLEIFNKVCDALAYAHSKNILHLDIKPDNIRLGPYGEVIVCDWGLGHILYSEKIPENDHYLENLDLQNEHTLHGYIRGTPGYMAPERRDNQKTIQADIFSLGALLYALLNYEIPFAGETPSEILKNTEQGELIISLSEVPIGLKSIYTKALKTQELERYDSVLELQEDVEKFRKGFATRAEKASFFKQLILLCKRNKLTCSLVAVFMMVICLMFTRYISDMTRGRKIILAEKIKAEEALELFKHEQQEKESIARHFTSLLVESTKNNTHGFELKKSLEYLSFAVKKDPSNSEAWLVKAYTHFIGHQFAEAYDCFARSGFGDRVKIAKKLSWQHRTNKGILSPESTVALLKEFGDTSNLVLTFLLLFDGQTRESLSDHSQVVKFFLESRNKGKDFHLDYNEQEASLDISNNVGLFNVDSNLLPGSKSFCLLKFLKLKKLNLTNTNFSNLNQLFELDLQELNLSNTLVVDLRPLLQMSSLTLVILNENQAKITRGKWPFEISYTDEKGNRDTIEQSIKKLLNSFQYVDQDKSGEISLQELLEHIPQYREEDLNLFFRLSDTNKNKGLSMNEIKKIIIDELKGDLRIQKYLQELIGRFAEIDVDGNGLLTLEEMEKIRHLSELTKTLQKLDTNNDQKISEEELLLQ